MKKIFTFAMFATVLFCFNEASAKIRRVGYFGTAIAKTDYTNLQSAQDSASAGDTILLFPGSYSSATINKKLIILGYGYFVTGTGSNANLQNITGSLSITIFLDSTSAGTTIEGLDGLTLYSSTYHNVKNISIRRCNLGVYFYYGTAFDNWQILQSNINTIYTYGSPLITNLRIDNSYINYIYFGGTLASGSKGQFNNDIFYQSDLGAGSFIIKNSVLLYYHSNDANCFYLNSIGTSDYYPIPSGNGNKNITYSSMNADVFVGYNDQSTYSNDGRWVLKSGSPAKGAGSGGTDAGIFGGTNPYKLSGIPRIPSFYKLTAPSTTTSSNPYTITFSVRSNN